MKSINQSAQRENNLSVVLRALRGRDDLTRVKLVEETGLAQATVTKIVNQLIEWGAISESDRIGTGLGRKAILLHFNADQYRAAAIRINRDYIVAAICDMAGSLYGMSRIEIRPEEGARHSATRLVQLLKDLIRQSNVTVDSIGVSVPGPYNFITKRISLMSGFPGWSDVDLYSILYDAFHLPVFIEQDANCGALAEMWYSDIHPDMNLLYIVSDRGVGAGLVLNSGIYRGKDGYAGEFGHSSINVFGPRCECGNRGCVELYGSTTALENSYKNEAFLSAGRDGDDDHCISVREILQLVRAGDPAACRAYSQTVTYLCFGAVGMVNLLNPHIVVFADRLTQGGELFLQVADRTFRQYLMPEVYNSIIIRTSQIEGDPMLLGAGVVAFDHMLDMPSEYFVRSKP